MAQDMGTAATDAKMHQGTLQMTPHKYVMGYCRVQTQKSVGIKKRETLITSCLRRLAKCDRHRPRPINADEVCEEERDAKIKGA